MHETAEHERLKAAREQGVPWKLWGPYLSERQWGTVREDYSDSGAAWDHFTHDHARSRAYRWGEDGLAGISDDQQRLCFALALWNERDPILKERLFGLTNSEGNHGEDVKEYYFYLDSTPTHSYMKYLYKYPQQEYPYEEIVACNAGRGQHDPEYELLDTGVFDDGRYFDVFVEYAKESPDDLLIKISAFNRARSGATLHVLPTLWFRNTWDNHEGEPKPRLVRGDGGRRMAVVRASHADLGEYSLCVEGDVPLLFTENETNTERISGEPNESPYVKDGIDSCVVHGRENAVNPDQTGTKVASHHVLNIPAGDVAVVRLRLRRGAPGREAGFGKPFEEALARRTAEADAFYGAVIPGAIPDDARSVTRQALAGMLWTKQYYYFDGSRWLAQHGSSPFSTRRRSCRNQDWFHMVNADIISMPDKWEYPWYAAWDLAFHTIPLALVDVDFAKTQLELFLSESYLHPNGQIPAYEWNFSDVNPPVHAWATLFLYKAERASRGQGDVDFLKRAFMKLITNFTWWVNRKDRFGKNVFEGGFLGLDNIGVFDRSAPLPTGGHLEQADGTAWMAMFCQNMLEIGVEIAAHDPTYEDLAAKFMDHFLWIAAAVNKSGPDGLWDEEDGFYYDILRLPDGSSTRLKVRSMVGLLPLAATTVIEKWQRDRTPRMTAKVQARLDHTPELFETIHPTGPGHRGVAERGIAALVNADRLRRILWRMLDEDEFLSPYGIRALSRQHAENPYVYEVDGREYRVDYVPAESNNRMFGGNSNWRGPVWFPVNAVLVRALLHFYMYYGDSFKVEMPSGSGVLMNLYDVAKEISARLARIFLRDRHGRRPVHGDSDTFQSDPHWRDHILFYEYFHGDTGVGLGSSHQTGWTGVVANLIQMFAEIDAEQFLELGKRYVAP